MVRLAGSVHPMIRRSQRKFMDVLTEDIQMVGVTEQDATDRVR